MKQRDLWYFEPYKTHMNTCVCTRGVYGFQGDITQQWITGQLHNETTLFQTVDCNFTTTQISTHQLVITIQIESSCE